MAVLDTNPGRRQLQGNVVDYLLGNARRECGGATYLCGDAASWTYGELHARVARAANFLRSAGIEPGQRVLFSVVDGIDFPTLFLGIMQIGAVAVPVNTFLKSDDYGYFAQDSGARMAVLDHSLAAVVPAMRATAPDLSMVVCAGQRAAGMAFLEDALAAASEQPVSHPSAPDDTAFLLYSSGSTGKPKGVVHSGAHVFWATELFGFDTLGLSNADVILSPPKMFFAFGLGNQVYMPLRAGARVIANSAPVTAENVWRSWIEHEPTVVMAVPTLFANLLRIAEESLGRERVLHACRRLRLCVSGGEVLPPALLERWRKFCGLEILDGVGTTEMTHMFMLNRPGAAVPGSCGRLVQGFRAEILDSGNRSVPPGEIGNLKVYGPTAATQYWNNPEQTASIMGNGGVLTGDKFYRDESGNYFLAGRADDMLRVGGIWVSPTEVESALASHEAVLECAVVGFLDREEMIKPKAFIVLREAGRVADESLIEALRSHVRDRLAHIKCPRWFEFVPELPKTSTGKIQRFKLRSGA